MIAVRRKELDLTLKEIAEKVGVSEATVQRWESGEIVNLRHKRIVKLAEVLKVHPGELMGWGKPSDDDAYLYKDFKLTKEDIKFIETYRRAKASGDPVLKALVDAIDRHIEENARKGG